LREDTFLKKIFALKQKGTGYVDTLYLDYDLQVGGIRFVYPAPGLQLIDSVTFVNTNGVMRRHMWSNAWPSISQLYATIEGVGAS